jgi:cbb3-type cytochrome c oxidase subunit I
MTLAMVALGHVLVLLVWRWKGARRPGSAALAFMTAGAAWFLIATLYGMVAAIHLVAPEFFNNIPALVFGRTRPVHVNTVIFGFTASMLVGCAMYYVPALLKTKLWSERLGWASFVLWQAAVLSGEVGFPFGLTQGREYAEYVWIFDVYLTTAIVGLLVNMVMTAINRQEKTLYVSVWYAFGMLLWTAGVYPLGNVMWHPATGAMPGLIDSIFLWFYGHNLVGLLLTPLAVGVAYFVVPRVVGRPLYSHTLSLVGFFSLAAIYTHIGGHHILQAPIPDWLKTITVVDSVMMIIPVFVVLTNLWLTARGAGGKLWRDPAGRFVIAGTIWYLITCLQGPFQSLPSVQQITHFNNWTIGHAHIAVLGFAGFTAVGGMWHVLPLVTRRQWYSARLINLQFGLTVFGLVGFFVVLTTAGLVQGTSWAHGETVYKVLPQLAPFMVARAGFGMFIIAAAGIGLYNLIMTITRGKPLGSTDFQSVPPGSTGFQPVPAEAGHEENRLQTCSTKAPPPPKGGRP